MHPRKIAHWRYEQISELLDDTLSTRERRLLLRRITRVPLRWPRGADRAVSEATLYRWIRAYSARGIEGLMPKRRKKQKRSRPLPRRLLERAIALLREEPRRSLTMLQALLEAERRPKVSRSTLHRHLQAHRAYPALRRMARGNLERRLRRRFEATFAHQIWQSDSKGPFLVKFEKYRRTLPVHVMSVIDDFSRGVLAAEAVQSPDLRAAVLVFRAAARRWGLPGKFYADRASIYDSYAFRASLAELGVHRIPSRAKNPSARGKIEAYHRILVSWFIRELRHQRVHDLEHLNRLLTGLLQGLYMDHRHRGLKKSPREALGEKLSDRKVSLDRLSDAFLVRTKKKAHPKTGEVELSGTLFKVSRPLAGKNLHFAFDPVDSKIAYVEKPNCTRERLRLAVEKVLETHPADKYYRGTGRLQTLYEDWQGRKLPQAQAAFGLPEIFSLFSKHLRRSVPSDEEEARLLQDFYHKNGPLERGATEAVLRKIFRKLGPKRPLSTYLAALRSRINPPPHD